MTRLPRTFFLSVLALVFAPVFVFTSAIAAAQNASGATPSSTVISSTQSSTWVASWAASQQIPEPQNALPSDDLRDSTLRQIVHLSLGGSVLRVHLSNAFGIEALHFTSVHIARPLSPASPPIETSHPGSRATSYYVHGDLVSAPDLPTPKHIDHWYQLAGIDVLAPAGAASIVALGDSITDGHAATTNGNDRWTDVLAARLAASPATHNLGVSNQGIGGNHLLTDGLGPNVLARFDRDVLAQAGVRWLIVFEGVNDLGGLARNGPVPAEAHAALVARVLAAYQQIIARAHAQGLRVYGATITPYVGSGYYHPDPPSEADRQAVNAWIRAPGHFNAVIDFDAVVRDPAHPDRLLPALDCSDHLHPSPAGYHAMGAAIPLELFAQ
jgi:lysophospholipase L1-like esterase